MAKKQRVLAMLATFLITASSLSASALSVGETYQYDEKQTSIHAPSAYNVREVLYGASFGTDSLRNPTDLFVDGSKQLYITDSGNNRIVVLDENYQLQEIISSVLVNGQESRLNAPMGVYKDDRDSLLYICDTGNARVIAVNAQHEVVLTIDGKGLPAVNENLTFTPEKVVADHDKNVLVVSSAVYQGIMRFGPDGRFESFYAPNSVQMTVEVFLVSLWKRFFTSEQKNMITKTLPASYNNLMIDEEGFVYATSSKATQGEEVKRLNAMGDNILKTAGKTSGSQVFGDYEVTVKDKKATVNSFVDVDVDDEGIMTVIDGQTNKIFQYDQSCDPIAVFGGTGTQKGLFKKVVSIVSLNGEYLVLDKDKGSLTVFEPSPYIMKIRAALKDYNEGNYIGSEESWRDILQDNSNFVIAYRSIGRAALQQNRYTEALQALKKGDDPYFYSLTLKEYRKEFVREHFLVLLIGACAGVAALVFLFRWIRKKLLS